MKRYPMRSDPQHPLTASSAYTQAGLAHLHHEHPTCNAYSASSDADLEFSPADNIGTEERDELIQEHIRKFADLANVREVHFTRQFASLARTTKLKRASAVDRLCKVIIQQMAADSPEELKQLVEDQRRRKLFLQERTVSANQFLETIADVFMNAPSPGAKRQALSLVASFVSYRELLEYIPTLTLYYYKAARRHAKLIGPGVAPPQETHVKERYDRKKVDMFIEFITSPHIVIDLPYGTATVKRASGVKEEIPNLIRIMNDEHIITQYLEMLRENGDDQYALSRSSLRRILSVCTAQTRKSLQGLDYFTYAGTMGFDTMLEIANKLGEYNQDQAWEEQIRSRLRYAKQYLKQQYKLHVRLSSPVADHCMMYALSDVKKSLFASACTDHQHLESCEQCDDLRQMLEEINQKIHETSFPTAASKRDAQYEWSNAQEAIMEWKKHIIRSVLQDKAKMDIIKSLRPNQVFLQMDWAMKWLPASSREDQASFFGKRGIPWHITVAITRRVADGIPDEEQYEMHTYVHVFDHRQQDSQAVMAILSDVLERIRQEAVPGQDVVVDTAYVRSDNAGCYHSSPIIAAIPKISSTTGVRVARWDFSDPQAGKGPCDRAAASIKRQVRMYIDENHQATNALEFINCATAHGRIKYTSFIYASVSSPSSFRQASIPQISFYYNFEFSAYQIVAWKAYNVGNGYSIPARMWSPDKQSVATLEVMTGSVAPPASEPSWKKISVDAPEHTHDTRRNALNHANDNEDEDTQADVPEARDYMPLFYCPEEGCSSVFRRYSDLLKHMDNGRHHYQTLRQDLREYAIDSYKAHIDRMQVLQPMPFLREAMVQLSQIPKRPTVLKRGWALRTPAPSKVFSKKQRDFLIAKFDLGITDKKKQDADAVAKAMRANAQFEPDEWLTSQQIKAFWSREAKRRRDELPQHNNDNPESVDVIEYMNDPDPYVDDYTSDILATVKGSNIFLDE